MTRYTQKTCADYIRAEKPEGYEMTVRLALKDALGKAQDMAKLMNNIHVDRALEQIEEAYHYSCTQDEEYMKALFPMLEAPPHA